MSGQFISRDFQRRALGAAVLQLPMSWGGRVAMALATAQKDAESSLNSREEV